MAVHGTLHGRLCMVMLFFGSEKYCGHGQNGSCLLHMQHAMTTHTTLTHGGFLISKYTVVWGPRWYHKFIKIMEFGLRWVHLGRYELILRQDGF